MKHQWIILLTALLMGLLFLGACDGEEPLVGTEKDPTSDATFDGQSAETEDPTSDGIPGPGQIEDPQILDWALVQTETQTDVELYYGQETQTLSIAGSKTFTYDDKKDLTKIETTDSFYYIMSSTYDKHYRANMELESIEIAMTTSNNFDHQHRITQSINKFSYLYKVSTYSSTYHYDQEGKLESTYLVSKHESIYDPERKSKEITTDYTYDDQGRIQTVSVISYEDPDGSSDIRREFVYNEQGMIVEVKESQNSACGNVYESSVTKIEYGDNGMPNSMTYKLFEEDYRSEYNPGQPMECKSHWTVRIFESTADISYDSEDRLSSVEVTSLQYPLSHYDPTVVRSSEDRLILWEYDNNDNPTKRSAEQNVWDGDHESLTLKTRVEDTYSYEQKEIYFSDYLSEYLNENLFVGYYINGYDPRSRANSDQPFPMNHSKRLHQALRPNAYNLPIRSLQSAGQNQILQPKVSDILNPGLLHE